MSFDQIAYIRERCPSLGCECVRPCVTYRVQDVSEKWHHYPWAYGLRVGPYDGTRPGSRWSHRDAAIMAYAHKHNLTEAEVCEQLGRGLATMYPSNDPCGWVVSPAFRCSGSSESTS